MGFSGTGTYSVVKSSPQTAATTIFSGPEFLFFGKTVGAPALQACLRIRDALNFLRLAHAGPERDLIGGAATSDANPRAVELAFFLTRVFRCKPWHSDYPLT